MTLHVPFGGQDDVPTATLTWPGLAPKVPETSPSRGADATDLEAEPAPAALGRATIESEALTVEVPAIVDAPVETPATPARGASSAQAAPAARAVATLTSAAASAATPDPIDVGLVSPAAGRHGSLAETWSRFLPTPSELRSVRMPAPDSPGTATAPKSGVAPAGGDDEWSSLNESDRDVAEFQSLFRARFGRTATASVDGGLRLHRPVIAFERQLAARRQLDRPSEGGSALISRASDRAGANAAASGRKATNTPAVAVDTSFGSTGVRRGLIGNDPADEGLIPKTAVKLRPFRVPPPDAPTSSGEAASPGSNAPAASAERALPTEGPRVVGDDDIPEIPSDWLPRQ